MHLGARLSVQVGNLGVIGAGAIEGELLHLGADGHDQGLLILGQFIEHGLGHEQGLEHEPVGLALFADGEVLGDFLQPEGNEAGRRRGHDVDSTRLHGRIGFARGQRQGRRTGGLGNQVHLPAAAAELEAFDVFRSDDRDAAAGGAAGLPDPGHQDHAFVGEQVGECLADFCFLPGVALLVGSDQPRHQRDVEFRHLAARVGQGNQRHVQRAFANRAELRVHLHERRAGIDVGLERAVTALLQFL